MPPIVEWFRLEATADTAGPTVRESRIEATATLPTAPKVRWSRLSADVASLAILAPISAQTVEPQQVVTVTATLSSGPTPDSYTWRIVSGPAVTLSGTGATRTFIAPSAMPPTGTAVTIGVAAVVAGSTGPEQQVTITVLPQLSWAWNGTTWVGARPVAI